MTSKASHGPRKTLMSFVVLVPSTCDSNANTADHFRRLITNHNAQQQEQAARKHRFAPIHISELRFICELGIARVLVKTDGDQFQFTRWYDFINSVFGVVETTSVEDKVAQIQTFKTHMRVLSGDSVLDFPALSNSRTPAGKRARDSGESGEDIAAKQLLALSGAGAGESHRPVETKVDGSHTKMMQQTVLVGQPPTARQALSFGSGAPALAAPPRAPVDWIAPPSDSLGRLCDFFLGRLPVYKQPMLFDEIEAESRDDEYKRKKKGLNYVPNVMKTANKLLPAVITHSQTNGKLPDGLAFDLVELAQVFQQTSWQGVFTLFLPAYPVELTYGIGQDVARRSCFVELWRRALKLEGALAKQTLYLRTLMECATSSGLVSAGQTPPSLSTVPPQAIGNIRALLSAGAGAFGSGATFWHARPDGVAYLQCLPEGGRAEVLDAIHWLQANRAAAFEALYPQVDELSLMPTLALIFGLRAPLASLDAEGPRKQVLEAVRDDCASRVRLYAHCLGWLVHYGARLTR